MISQDCRLFSKPFSWPEDTLKVNFYLDEKMFFHNNSSDCSQTYFIFYENTKCEYKKLKKL